MLLYLLKKKKKSPYLISEIPIELSEAVARGKSHSGGCLSQVLRISNYSPHLMAFTCSPSRLILCWHHKHRAHPGDGLLGDVSCLADLFLRVIFICLSYCPIHS